MAGKKAERDRLRREAAVVRVAAAAEFVDWMSVCDKVMAGDVEGLASLLSAARVRYIPPVDGYEYNYPRADLFFEACLRAELPGMDAIVLKIAQMLVHEALTDPTFDLKSRKHGSQYLTPLHCAVISGMPSVVETLLPHVDLLAENVLGETAHRFAVSCGKPELAKIIDNHLAQLERGELEASVPAAAPTAPVDSAAARWPGGL